MTNNTAFMDKIYNYLYLVCTMYVGVTYSIMLGRIYLSTVFGFVELSRVCSCVRIHCSSSAGPLFERYEHSHLSNTKQYTQKDTQSTRCPNNAAVKNDNIKTITNFNNSERRLGD